MRDDEMMLSWSEVKVHGVNVIATAVLFVDDDDCETVKLSGESIGAPEYRV